MKTTKKTFLTLCLLPFALSVFASATWHVAPGGDDALNSGEGWDSPFATVGKAVQEAATGDEVVVSNGVYTLSQQIVVDKGITVRSLHGAAVTTLDGNNATRVIRIAHADAVVDGFTIKRGVGDSAEGYAGGNTVGGGVMLQGGSLINASILTNSAYWGGGVFFVGSDSVVSNCLVQGNTCTQYGGGLSNRNQTGGRLVNNTIRNNSGWGAGVWMEYATMENNVVAYNTDPANYSGGVRQWGGTNRNSLVYRNVANLPAGGGLYVTHAGLVENNSVVYNTAAATGGNNWRSSGLRAEDASVIRNTIVWGNTYSLSEGAELRADYNGGGTVTYSCWPNGTAGTGNIASNPQFVNVTSDNYSLGALSPCLDQGQNQDWMTGATDVAGKARIINTTVDMGAYEREDSLGVGFTASVTTGFAPLEVVFTSVVVGDTSGLTYHWSFADGGTTTDLQGDGLGTVTNSYEVPGSFTAALTVSNANEEAYTYVLPIPITVGVEHTYAAPDGGNIAPYNTWAKAAQNIADALAYSSDGTTLTVANGTYTLTQQLVVDKAVLMRSQNGSAVTILDGNNVTRVIHINNAGAVVDGFTIKRGLGSVAAGQGSGGGGVHTVGGGVLLTGGLLANCTVATNSAAEGAGVFFSGSASVVSNCLVQGNTASRYGGGLANSTDSVSANGTLVGNTIRENSAPSGGGGVWIDGGMMKNNVVAYNTGSGGIRQRGGTNRNSLVHRNTSASSTGGGIYVSHGGLIENNTVAYNDGGTGGPDPAGRSAGLRANDFNDTSVIRNTIVWGNTFVGSEVLLPPLGSMTYSCWPGGTSGTGNVALNPQFRNPTVDNFSIPFHSPCADSGLNQSWMVSATDVVGMPRIFRLVVDMGALEDHVPSATVIVVR